MRRAMTLVELLICIAITAVLAGILFPVFVRAKESAYETRCVGNLHDQFLAISIYRHDNDGDGRYGDLYTMGLPPIDSPEARPNGKYRCGGPQAPPNAHVATRDGYPYRYFPVDPEIDAFSETWAEYAQRAQENAMLLGDLNHNAPSVRLDLRLYTKRAFGIRLSGQLVHRLKRFSPTPWSWWDTP